jgi:hypothetical protein
MLRKSMSTDVSMLRKSMSTERVLAASLPEKRRFLRAGRGTQERGRGSLVDSIMGVIDKAKAAKDREAGDGNKYSAELKGGQLRLSWEEFRVWGDTRHAWRHMD